MSLTVAQKDATFRNRISFTVVSTQAAKPPENLREHLSALREHGATLRFARNTTLFQEGDRAEFVYRVVSGTVRLCRHTPDGRRHIADFVMGGDLLGSLGEGEQSFTAEAVSDVVCVAYPRMHFDRLSERDPRFRANVLRHLSGSLMAAQLHTFVLGCQSAKERLASFIVRMAERTGAMDEGRVELAMGRQDIADHLGLTIETICRAVTALKNEDVIAVPNTHQLVLRNVDALFDLASGGAID